MGLRSILTRQESGANGMATVRRRTFQIIRHLRILATVREDVVSAECVDLDDGATQIIFHYQGSS